MLQPHSPHSQSAYNIQQMFIAAQNWIRDGNAELVKTARDNVEKNLLTTYVQVRFCLHALCHMIRARSRALHGLRPV